MYIPTSRPFEAFAAMIEACENTPSKNDKQAIIANALNTEHGADIAKLLNYALSPYITFGVKQLPDLKDIGQDQANPDFKLPLVYAVLDKLASRGLTGNAAKETIAITLGYLPADQREFLKRIVLKDLRAGFSESTVNKAKPGTVPVFGCQLADGDEPDLDDLCYPLYVEPKFDGVRTIAVKKNGIVTLLSRNGLPFENFEEVEQYLLVHMPDDTVFDGEVLHAEKLGQEGYALVMKRAKADRGKNVAGNPVCYQVFDGMSLADWESGAPSRKIQDRKTWLVNTLASMPASGGHIRITDFTKVNNAAQLTSIYEDFVAQGFEGVIIKQLDKPYTFKRNKSWMKLKPFQTIDLVVVGVTEGQGKYTGMLGTLVCTGRTIDGVAIQTEVGSGFTDSDRALLWADRGALVGRHLEVRYQDMSKAQDTTVHSLRFPTFVRFRASDAVGKV